MTPTQLPNESHRAFAAFKKYVAMGDKHSIRALCRNHGKDRATCERWSKKYRWQKRIRELTIEDTKRSAHAADQAALETARERERLALRHTKRKLQASERLFARAHQVLRQSARNSRPSDSARMFVVAALLGDQVVGLGGSAQTGHFGMNPIEPPNITVVHYRDDQSDVVDAIQRQFLRDNPTDPAAVGRIDTDELAATAATDAELLREWERRKSTCT